MSAAIAVRAVSADVVLSKYVRLSSARAAEPPQNSGRVVMGDPDNVMAFSNSRPLQCSACAGDLAAVACLSAVYAF